MFSRRVWAWLLLVTAGVGLVFLVSAGCSSTTAPTTAASAPGISSSSTTSLSSTTSTSARSYEPVTSRWPPGVEAVVLSAETGLYLVGSEGVRWAKEAPPRPKTRTTLSGRPVVSGLDGLAVSGRFMAYVDADKEIAVRALADGTILKRMAFESQGHTTLRSLSDDGTMLALVTVDPGREAREESGKVPWTITVVNLATGTAIVADTLAAFVEERIAEPSSGGCGLVALDWLPGDTLLAGMSGRPYRTYLYHPLMDTMELMPDVQYVWAVGPAGMVLGQNLDAGQVFVWRDGAVESVVPDASWPHVGSGTISTDGTALVLMVSKTGGWMLTDAHGWQTFAKVGSEWRSSGPVAQVDWMNQPPTIAGGDGHVAWTVVYRSTGENRTVLLSHDFETGTWEEWFGPEDLWVGFGSFYFAGIIPE